MSNNNSYYMVPLNVRNDIRKIRRYQNTKAIVLNSEMNKLLNSLNKFNNDYSKLINNVEKKLLEVHHVNNNNHNIENFNSIQVIQNGIINQLIKLNNIFSAMNEYIDNLQGFIDQSQINPSEDEIKRVEEKKNIEDIASRMAMTYISTIMTNNRTSRTSNTSQLNSNNNHLLNTDNLNEQERQDNNDIDNNIDDNNW